MEYINKKNLRESILKVNTSLIHNWVVTYLLFSLLILVNLVNSCDNEYLSRGTS